MSRAWRALEMLNIMSTFQPDSGGPQNTVELHKKIEAMNLAYADLYRYTRGSEVCQKFGAADFCPTKNTLHSALLSSIPTKPTAILEREPLLQATPYTSPPWTKTATSRH